ncbi:MAG TPA: immunoglobulin domain-containing protein [Verrucomicrobiae bacterium]|nr:immunoglobulin domain-containing protein [Verrucomicrobiae bacterium]
MKNHEKLCLLVFFIIFAHVSCPISLLGQTGSPEKSPADASPSAVKNQGQIDEAQTTRQNRELLLKKREDETLKWCLQNTLDAYEKSALTNPAWNTPVKNAMTAYAQLCAGGNYGAEEFQIATNCEAAIDAGCKDPFISYLNTKFNLAHKDFYTPENFPRYLHLLSSKMGILARSYCLSAPALNNSEYPPICKFYGSISAAISLRDILAAAHDPEVATIYGGLRQSAATNLLLALHDRNMPPSQIFESCDLFLNHFATGEAELKTVYESIERTLFENHDRYVGLVVRGRFYIDFAWLARGGDWAGNVTPDGWEKFNARLEVSEKALNEAWDLNPQEPLIPTTMLTLELGQGKGRGRMETWFLRAMSLDPDNAIACDKKSIYLEPKWYGTREKVMVFCRDCLNSSAWGGKVPLTLADEYISILEESKRDIQAELMSRSTNTDDNNPIVLHNQPEENFTWSEVKTAFEKYLKNNPADVLERQRYIRDAIKSGQWDSVKEQLPMLGGAHYADILGKEAVYASIVEKAQATNRENAYLILPPKISMTSRTPGGAIRQGDTVTFTTRVEDQFVPENGNGRIYVKVQNHYQWNFEGKNIPDATNSTYILQSAQPSDSGYYSVTITNAGGSMMNTLSIFIRDRDFRPHAPKIISQPYELARKLGEHTTLRVSVQTGMLFDRYNTNKFGWVWQFNGKEVHDDTKTNSNWNGSRQALIDYDIKIFSTNDVGEYSLTVTNLAGSAVSSNISLSIKNP